MGSEVTKSGWQSGSSIFSGITNPKPPPNILLMQFMFYLQSLSLLKFIILPIAANLCNKNINLSEKQLANPYDNTHNRNCKITSTFPIRKPRRREPH